MSAAAYLWVGKTRHVRHAPFRHEFDYRVAMISLDVDRIDEADRACGLFSIDRANLVSLHRKKLAGRNDCTNLRAWAEARLGDHGATTPLATITIVTFPSVLGSGFAPISIWIARDPSQRIAGVIYEVHNTFGEAHAYAFAPDRGMTPHTSDKEFHVSPFFDVTGSYRFRLSLSDERLSLLIQNIDEGVCIHTAHLALAAQDMTDAKLAACLIGMPFSGFGVILAIHWQALKLWFKGARYRKKPSQGRRRATRAVEIEQTIEPHAERRSA